MATGLPECPWADPPPSRELGAFLAVSSTTLAGQDRTGRRRRRVGRLGQPALAACGLRPVRSGLAVGLAQQALERWRRALAGVRADGRARVVRLRFVDPPGGRGGRAVTVACSSRRRRGGRRSGCCGEPGARPGETVRSATASTLRGRTLALAPDRPDLTGLANRRQGERWLAAPGRPRRPDGARPCAACWSTWTTSTP